MSSQALSARFKNLGSGWVVLCIIAFLLAGCARSTPTPEPVTIAFAHPEVDSGRYEELVETFNTQHPYITVELLPRDWNMLDNLGAGDVDVFVTEPFALLALQADGQVLNLDPFIERDEAFNLADFYGGTIDLLQIEGRLWAVPGGVDVLVMYYNQDLFDQRNYPYPEVGWTWDDFLNAALAINDPNAGIYGYATTGPMNSLTYFDAALFVYQHGGRLIDDLDNPTRIIFDDPLTIDAMDWYARLYHEHDVAPTQQDVREAYGGNQYAIFDGLRRGNIGMWVGWFSDRGGFTWPVEWLMNWGIATLPQDQALITQAEVEGLAIYSQTEHPDACWEWILFLTQQSPYRLMPARKSLAESSTYEEFVGEGPATTLQASMENAVLISPRLAAFEDVLSLFAQAAHMIVEEEFPASEAMNWAQQQSGQ
jgi:multiple sugar transport system substrate-binding protein